MDLKNHLLEHSEIYLFECPQRHSDGPSSFGQDDLQNPKVNDFVNFLKYFRLPTPFKFTTISSENNLISDLSLKENILMNFNFDSLTRSKNHQFDQVMASIANPYITPFLQYFHEGDLTPHEASKEAMKSAQLLKALLSDSQYIFMESPEKDLSYQQFSIFLKALKFHCQSKVVNVFISSPNPELWLNEAQYMIRRNEKLEFVVEKARNKDLINPIQQPDLETKNLVFKFPDKKQAA